RGMGAAVKWLAAHIGRGLVRDADGEQHLAVGGAFAHGVIAIVGAIEIVVGVDMQAVGALEQAFAPALDEIAVAIEHDHRVLAAIEDVDAVLAVDRHGGRIGELPAVRQFGPVLHYTITMLAGAEDVFHVLPPICRHSGMRRKAQARNPSWLWIPGSRYARPGMTVVVIIRSTLPRSP